MFWPEVKARFKRLTSLGDMVARTVGTGLHVLVQETLVDDYSSIKVQISICNN
jgi:hypothetical protein